MKKIGKKIISILCVLVPVTSSKTSANESNKIEPKNQNIVNVNKNNKKTLNPLKVFGTMAAAFVGLAVLVALSTYIYFKIDEKNFKNTDVSKKHEEYKRKCKEIDEADDILEKEKEALKQKVWFEYYVERIK